MKLANISIAPSVIRKALKVVEKLWGWEVWLANSPTYCSKLLYLEKGFSGSLHLHPEKSEHFTVLQGRFHFFYEGMAEGIVMEEGDTFTIDSGHAHRFSLPSSLGVRRCVILETSSHHSDDDVLRLEHSCKL